MPAQTTLQDKVTDTVSTSKTPYWVAIIYKPKKESKEFKSLDSVDDNDNMRPMPSYIRQIMLPPQDNGTNGGGPAFDWIELKPGSNLNVLYSQWQEALKLKTVKPLIGLSIEAVAYSSIQDEIPGYRHFVSTEAIRLVKETTAVAWIDEWMVDEVRPEVIRAANERKATLETELAKRVS
jgi:hypothetical protein